MSKIDQASTPAPPGKKPRGRPVHVARVGNVRVPVYKFLDGRFCAAWQEISGGKRNRETFPTKKQAVERAEEVAFAIANSLADVVTLTNADRDSYRIAMQKLAGLGIPLHAAIDEYVAAKKDLGNHTLMEATAFFVRGHVDRLAVPASTVILDELLAQLRDDRRDESRYITPLRKDLTNFVAAFPDIQDATEEAIRSYLRDLKTTRATRDPETLQMIPAGAPVSPRRRDNIRDAIVSLMRFARKKDYLPADRTSAAERVTHIAEGSEVSTYTPKQLEQILTYFAEHDQTWLPWAAIQAFAGLRTSEIMRLNWDKVYLDDRKVISVSARVAKKVRVGRQPPILPVLEAWLSNYRDQTGPVIPRKWKDMDAAQSDALIRLRKALKWEVWDTNALRHSFGSHRLAIVKSVAQVAHEMGNSPEMVRENYNDPKPESEAIKYFAVMPSTAVTNVIRASFAS